MAEEHRRVEPRSIVGTGMLTDPDRIEALQHEREKMERTWRERPKRGFGEVLLETPGKPPEEEREDPRRRRRAAREARPEGEPDAEQGGEASVAASDDEAARAAARPPPRVPPDPRMRRLHELLERGKR